MTHLHLEGACLLRLPHFAEASGLIAGTVGQLAKSHARSMLRFRLLVWVTVAVAWQGKPAVWILFNKQSELHEQRYRVWHLCCWRTVCGRAIRQHGPTMRVWSGMLLGSRCQASLTKDNCQIVWKSINSLRHIFLWFFSPPLTCPRLHLPAPQPLWTFVVSDSKMFCMLSDKKRAFAKKLSCRE